jgi:DNA replication and repair protein RecF
VQELETQAARIHQRLTRSDEILRLVYQPSYDPLPSPSGQYALPINAPVDRSGRDYEEIREGFAKRLKALRHEEIARGQTTIGPHRDELRMLVNGIDLGDYGSRGQMRTALLALKLAEVNWMKERTGHWPVLLLDEILAELDAQRRSNLLDGLSNGEQAVLTTTDLHLFTPSFVQNATVWRLQAGAVVQTTEANPLT